MGIDGLWDIVKDSRTHVSLLSLCTQEMLSRKCSRSRPFILGVDFNNLFDKCAFGSRKLNVHNHELGANPEFRIFFNRLCEFLIVAPGAVLVFVSDGDRKPPVKRGKKVKKTPSWFLQHVGTLVNAFGYRYHQAPGEAEAELARLNSEGLIDAIITDDSDSLVFGAKRVIRRVEKDHTKDYYVYDAENIGTTRHLCHEDLIFFALLAGGDYHDGVAGCGEKTCHKLADHEFQFGEKLLHARRTLSDEDFSAIFLPDLRANIGEKLKSTTRISLENFPDCNALNLYASPMTSWTSGSSNAVDTSRWIHREPNIRDIARFCDEHFKLPANKLRAMFRTKLWHGVFISMLSSKYKVYDEESKELYTPNISTLIISVKRKIASSDGGAVVVNISTSKFVAAMQIGDDGNAVKGDGDVMKMKIEMPENLLGLLPYSLPSIEQPMVAQPSPKSSNQNGTILHPRAEQSSSSTLSSLNAQTAHRFIDLTQPEDLGVLDLTVQEPSLNFQPDHSFIDLTQPEVLGVLDLTVQAPSLNIQPATGFIDLTSQHKDSGVIDLTLEEPIVDLGEIYLTPEPPQGKRKATSQSDDPEPPSTTKRRMICSDHEVD